MGSSEVTADRVFHALSDSTRRAIFERLSYGPFSVSALAKPLNITVTAVAQHMQILEECRLVQTEKVGRVRTCRIEHTGLSVLEAWIRDQRTHCDERLNISNTVLKEREPDAGEWNVWQ